VQVLTATIERKFTREGLVRVEVTLSGRESRHFRDEAIVKAIGEATTYSDALDLAEASLVSEVEANARSVLRRAAEALATDPAEAPAESAP
jgi:hypothetical protein